MAVKTVEIDNLTNDQLYGFRMFPRNLKGQYQTRNDKGTATATPKAGIPVSSLPVGTLIKDVNTKYYNEPIVWKIADQNHSGYPANSTTLISDKILTLKCFDAKEPSNSDSNRRSYGNNGYSVSNIRQWLNSQYSASNWYSPQHSSDSPPNSSNVQSGYNPYETEAGFLSSFNTWFIDLIIGTTITTVKPNIDGGQTESDSNQLIFLPSTTEVGLPNENNIAEGSKLALFNDNNSRLAYPTAEAVNNSDLKPPTLSEYNPWYWWIRTPKFTSSENTYFINANGYPIDNSANYGGGGIRPLCNIKNDTVVSLQPDTDGAYIIQF